MNQEEILFSLKHSNMASLDKRMRLCIAYPLEVMDDICRVTAPKMRHGNTDLLIVLLKVDAHVLLQFLASSQGSVHRVLVDDPAVE